MEGGEGSARLDRVLAARVPDLSRSRLKALILAGQVSINKATVGTAPVRDPAYHVAAGDTIQSTCRRRPISVPQGETIALDIVYEDDDIIVIDKPAGLVVHPAAGHASGTLVNALIAHCGASLSGIGGVKRPGIVHRLDKDTSGLMVVAKNDRAHSSLTAQFADHGRTGQMRRGYLAFRGAAEPDPRHGRCAIDRHPHAREKMAVREGGREAVTHYEVRESFNGHDGKPVASLLACQLETGRTHQIRVHLAHIGHPLLGDSVHGPRSRPRRASSGRSARRRSLRWGVRRCTLIYWYWGTLVPEIFSAGNHHCRGIVSSSTGFESGAMTQGLGKALLCPVVIPATREGNGTVTSKKRTGLCILHLRQTSTRNIASRPALTQRPTAGPAAIGGLNHWRALYMARTATLPIFNGESGLSSYLAEIRKFPMLEPQVNTCSPSVGASMTIATRRKNSSPPSPARGQDRHGLSRLRPADLRGRLGRQCRPDAGGEAFRA